MFKLQGCKDYAEKVVQQIIDYYDTLRKLMTTKVASGDKKWDDLPCFLINKKDFPDLKITTQANSIDIYETIDEIIKAMA